jgi:hypothetical protein
MNRPLLPSLLLVSSLLVVAGCQKDVQEVRRTDPEKYGVDSGTYAAHTGARYQVDTGRSTVYTGSYQAGGVTQGAPSAPRLAPVGVGTPSRKAEND